MNQTEATPNHIKDYYIVCSLSSVFALTATFLSATIITVICKTKPRLHTVRHLLVCNTCIASTLFSATQTNSYIFLIFLPWETSDIKCRWRGYLSYVSIVGVTYSFLIQAISRLFISVFSTKHKNLIKFKTHYILIVIQWLTAIILPLPSIITEDIVYVPNRLCWVPMEKMIHLAYGFIAYYSVPAFAIFMIYIFIYFQVKDAQNSDVPLVRLIHGGKRDLELLRNIMILLSLYFIGGIPILIYLISSIRIIYLACIVTVSLVLAIEKLCTILLDQELRQVMRKIFAKRQRITALSTTTMMMRQRSRNVPVPTIVDRNVHSMKTTPV